MNLLTILFISFGLAMDAFAVSVTSGLAIRQMRLTQALKMALFFGGFQAAMPVLGWALGLSVRNVISGMDHWIAFALLTFVGGKMIRESRQETVAVEKAFLGTQTLLLLAVATSIDALAVGLSFSFLAVSVVAPAVIIGLVTFALSLAGVYIGKRFGHFFENYIGIIGGVILIGIGLKILFEHLTH